MLFEVHFGSIAQVQLQSLNGSIDLIKMNNLNSRPQAKIWIMAVSMYLQINVFALPNFNGVRYNTFPELNFYVTASFDEYFGAHGADGIVTAFTILKV